MTAKVDPPVLPEMLYRYRHLRDDKDLYRELEAIKEQYVWCSDYRKLNDPMEGFYQPSSRIRKHVAYRTIANSIYDSKHNIGICCFSDTFENELMWTHYATNYRGICVGYRTRELIAGLPDNVHLVRVAYDGEPPIVGNAGAGDARSTARKVLSHKKANWIYEREWRLLGPLDRLNITSKACVRDIRLGSRITNPHRHAIVTQLQRLTLRIFEMTVIDYRHDWKNVKRLK